MARSPLYPSLGTAIPCVYLSLVWIPLILLVLAFVSARKTKSGCFDLTSLVSVRTTREDPSPRQFHAIMLIGLGDAASQPPPHRHPFPFLPLVFDCPASYPFFFSSREHSNPTLVTRLGPRVSDWLGLLLNGLSPFLPPLPNVSSAHSLGLAFSQSIQASGLSSLPLGLALYQSFWASHLFI